MTLGDVFTEAAKRDLAGQRKLQKSGNVKSPLSYEETIDVGKLTIRLSTAEDAEAFVECSLPYSGLEEEENYARIYFLSMVFNAACHGMKRLKKLEQEMKEKLGHDGKRDSKY